MDTNNAKQQATQYITTTNDPALLDLIQQIKKTTGELHKAFQAVEKTKHGTKQWSNAVHTMTEKSKHLTELEVRLAYSFIDALESSQDV
ncbi:MAG: hypothetical protein H0X30_15935 [Anaerolineae bacterium]|nr:hypothetical protein [Anaerolineae bacterium]